MLVSFYVKTLCLTFQRKTISSALDPRTIKQPTNQENRCSSFNDDLARDSTPKMELKIQGQDLRGFQCTPHALVPKNEGPLSGPWLQIFAHLSATLAHIVEVFIKYQLPAALLRVPVFCFFPFLGLRRAACLRACVHAPGVGRLEFMYASVRSKCRAISAKVRLRVCAPLRRQLG